MAFSSGRKLENRYGSHFYENVSKDLRKTLGLTRGMSESTIRYTHYFYRLYSQLLEIRQQDAEDFKAPILQQDAGTRVPRKDVAALG